MNIEKIRGFLEKTLFLPFVSQKMMYFFGKQTNFFRNIFKFKKWIKILKK